jgi:hypothetical protein
MNSYISPGSRINQNVSDEILSMIRDGIKDYVYVDGETDTSDIYEDDKTGTYCKLMFEIQIKDYSSTNSVRKRRCIVITTSKGKVSETNILVSLGNSDMFCIPGKFGDHITDKCVFLSLEKDKNGKEFMIYHKFYYDNEKDGISNAIGKSEMLKTAGFM